MATDVQSATLLVTAGAVAFAVVSALWALRLTHGVRAVEARWREKVAKLEARLEKLDGVVAANPGVVMVWDDADAADDSGWGAPLIYGSRPALASLVSFADVVNGPNVGAAIIDSVVDYEARDALGGETTLRRALAGLRDTGAAFSIKIAGPAGRFFDVDGRPAGRRAVLWLADSTARTLEDSAQTGRIEEARHEIARDPHAFLDVLNRSPIPVWRMSSGLKTQWGNRAFLEAVEAVDLDDAVARDLVLDAGVRNQAKTALETGARVDEERAVTAAGARRQFQISVFPISGGVGAVAVDVTRAADAREALERHVRAQDDTLDHLDDAVVTFGPDKRMSFNNKAFRRLFDLDAEWLRTRPSHGELLDRLRDTRLIPDQADYPAWRKAELDLYQTADADIPDETWSLPGDRNLRVARVRHPMGGFLLIFRDMTERISLRSQFKTATRVLRAALDKLEEGVVVFASNGRIQDANAAFESMWELTPKQAEEGVPFDDIVAACRKLFHKMEVWDDLKARVTNPAPPVRQEVVGEMRRSDGSILTYISRPLPDGATVIAFNNVTAERNLRVALTERAEALEDADRVKSEFVNHVSYQLRAPLQTITGFAELLDPEDEVRPDDAPALPDRERGQLRAIRQASDDLTKLVDDVIDVAAIDSNTLKLNIAEMDVSPVMDAAVNLIVGKAQAREIKISNECESDVGSIMADSQRVKQVVYNLLLNAVDHSKAGGSIGVGARRGEDAVHFWVEDAGDGIAPEKLARVFERFEAGVRGGAGLGLTLARDLVELHGGMMDIESEVGVGTRVTFFLPFVAVVTEAADSAESDEPDETEPGATSS